MKNEKLEQLYTENVIALKNFSVIFLKLISAVKSRILLNSFFKVH